MIEQRLLGKILAWNKAKMAMAYSMLNQTIMIRRRTLIFFFAFTCNFLSLQAAEQAVAEWDFKFKENLLWVDAKIGKSKDLKFILDSACTDYVLDSEAAKRLQIQIGQADQTVRRLDGTEKQGLTPDLQMEVGSIRFQGINFVVVPLNKSTPDLQPIDGILGSPLFKKFLVQIDYQNLKIRLFNKDSPPQLADAIEVKLHQDDGLVGIKLADSKGNLGKFVVDTGSIHGVIISPHATSNFVKQKGGSCCKIRAGGEIDATYCSGTCWKLGSIPVSDLQTFYCQPPGAGLLACREWSGTLGNGFLSKFKVTFDYSAKKLYLQSAI